MDIEVQVVTHPCGEVNAFYSDGIVELCTEMVALGPDVTRGVLNHELAHAFLHQHGLLGLPDQEFQADELSWFFDTAQETLAMERFYLDMAALYPGPQGDHPKWLDRAGMFICLDTGETNEDHQCSVYLHSAYTKWSYLIAIAK